MQIKRHIQCLLWSLAYWVLDDHIKTHFIQRSHFNEYTKYMSRDFPVMEDMYEHFKHSSTGHGHLDNHRDAMKAKYIDKTDRNNGWDDAREAMFNASKK